MFHFIIANDILVIPLIAILVFIFAYLMSDRILNFFYEKSMGTREEVIMYMEKMYVKTDKEKLSFTIMLLSLGLGIIFFLLFWPNAIMGLIAGTIVTLLGWAAPKHVLKMLWEKRCGRVVNQMVDGLTVMGNGVKSGLSVVQAMERVVENMKGPLPQEFSIVLADYKIGVPVEEALNSFAERVPMADVQMFVTAINILKEAGGDLGSTFATIVNTIRERQKIEKKIEALTAQGVMQGIIITLVPFVLLVIFTMIDPNFIKPLFTTPLGWVFLLIMLGLQVIGGVMMKKVVTIKV